jgi:hypothetical protein
MPDFKVTSSKAQMTPRPGDASSKTTSHNNSPNISSFSTKMDSGKSGKQALSPNVKNGKPSGKV